MTLEACAGRRRRSWLRWYQEVWNQGRIEVVDELLAADCRIHDPFFAERVGLEADAGYVAQLRGRIGRQLTSSVAVIPDSLCPGTSQTTW